MTSSSQNKDIPMESELINQRRLWKKHLNQINYARQFEKIKKADEDWIKFLFEAREEFALRPMSVERSGVYTIGADYLMDMALRGVLVPGGLNDHLVNNPDELLYGASFVSSQGIHPTGFRTRQPFQGYDSLICSIGNSRHDGDTLERTRRSTRVIAGDLFATPDYTYGVVAANFIEGLYPEILVFEQSMGNMLHYLEIGGFFAVTVMIEARGFVTPDGIHIPMPMRITVPFLHEVFDKLGVKYKIYMTEEDDIRPGEHNGVALIAGRKIKA
jgi:hypothetical protein